MKNDWKRRQGTTVASGCRLIAKYLGGTGVEGRAICWCSSARPCLIVSKAADHSFYDDSTVVNINVEGNLLSLTRFHVCWSRLRRRRGGGANGVREVHGLSLPEAIGMKNRRIRWAEGIAMGRSIKLGGGTFFRLSEHHWCTLRRA